MRGKLLTFLFVFQGVVIIASLVKVVKIRQMYKRSLKGRPLVSPKFMFPRISRADADKNILHCIKYLFNFGFYKFGLEVINFYQKRTVLFKQRFFLLFFFLLAHQEERSGRDATVSH